MEGAHCGKENGDSRAVSRRVFAGARRLVQVLHVRPAGGRAAEHRNDQHSATAPGADAEYLDVAAGLKITNGPLANTKVVTGDVELPARRRARSSAGTSPSGTSTTAPITPDFDCGSGETPLSATPTAWRSTQHRRGRGVRGHQHRGGRRDHQAVRRSRGCTSSSRSTRRRRRTSSGTARCARPPPPSTSARARSRA